MINFKTFAEFQEAFNSERQCRQYFEQTRFRNGDYCPHCRHKEIQRFKDGKRYRCALCRKDFTIKTGTLFGESKVPLTKWFLAIYLLTSSKKGISSIELADKLGVSQKTAWFIDHRIREALRQGKNLLTGTIEADETYVGGKEKNKHFSKRTKNTQGRSTRTKTAVMGILQRKGEIRADVIPSVRTHIIEEQILKNVRQGSRVYTDDLLSYAKLGRFFEHEVVRHGRKEYVRGDVHSNRIESFWALFKRGYHGTYHSMSKKHLQRYVNEFVYRFNRRELERADMFSDVVNRIAKHSKMSYKTLTA